MVGDERSWYIELTSDDCVPPAAHFGLDVAQLTGSLERVEVQQVQEHSPRISASVVVGLGDGEMRTHARFSPYSTANEVKVALQESGALGESVDVMRTGTCQTGFGWLVTMTHLAGDVPLMTASLVSETAESQDSLGAFVNVYPYIDGGHLMGPGGSRRRQ